MSEATTAEVVSGAIQEAAPAAEETPTEVTEPVNPEQAAQEATQAKAIEQAKKDLNRKYNLKVNNKIKEVNLDLNNDAEVQKYIQKALAADEKFEEAATIRKQAEMLVNALKTNPLAVLSHPELGLDIKALAQQVLTQEIEDLKKSPEQKRIEDLESKLKAKEEREKQLEDEKRNAEMAKIQEQAYQELDDQIATALGKSDLPKSPYVVKRIADAMIEAVNLGYEDVTVDQILPFVEGQITEEFQRMFDEAPEQVAEKLMEKVVGKKNLDRYRKTKIARVKKPTESTSSIRDTGSKVKEEQKPQEPVNFKKMFSPW